MKENNSLEKLHSVLQHLKETFVGKDIVIDLLGISLLAGENTFILGPPGTAKSAIIRTLSDCLTDGKNFEYLLTRFTEPNEIFGPFDIRKLKDGELVTNTENMLPEASLVFLDEIFNANSAILNSLLLALNEKLFRRGKETKKLPALMFVGASNQLPEEETLAALLDRFLIRVKSEYVPTELLKSVLVAGSKLAKGKTESDQVFFERNDVIALQHLTTEISLNNVLDIYINTILHLRNVGIKISDRRAVKIQKLLAASAVICGRTEVITSDFWVIKHIWDTEDQIEVIAGIIDNVMGDVIEQNMHPQSAKNKNPDSEELMKDILALKEKYKLDTTGWEEKNVIKDTLRLIQSRTNWISNKEHKEILLKEIDSLWEMMLKEV